MNTIQLPPLAAQQHASWLALLEFANIYSGKWTLIGGQAVHLHCWERDVINNRATTDIDALIDIKASPEGLFSATKTLSEMGFTPVISTGSGHHISWRRGNAQIDLMIAQGVGMRSEKKVGISGGTTIATSGGQEALNYTEKVLIVSGSERAVINRPTLAGLLIVKSEAAANSHDKDRMRHINDLLTLYELLSSEDVDPHLKPKEIAKIRNGIGVVDSMRNQISDTSQADALLAKMRIAFTS